MSDSGTETIQAGMQPSLRFANENYFEGGYHPMGYIGIGESVADTRLKMCIRDSLNGTQMLKKSKKKKQII